MFVSGNLALDLAGTLKWRRDEPAEHLSDLGGWLAGAGILDEAPRATGTDLARAKELREAGYALAAARAAGRPLDPAALELANAFAAVPPVRLTLTADGRLRREGDVPAALSEIARSLLTLLADADAVVKECARPACTRLFADRSRGRRRSWCGMQECGSQAKMAAYRARRRGDVPQRCGAEDHPRE